MEEQYYIYIDNGRFHLYRIEGGDFQVLDRSDAECDFVWLLEDMPPLDEYGQYYQIPKKTADKLIEAGLV